MHDIDNDIVESDRCGLEGRDRRVDPLTLDSQALEKVSGALVGGSIEAGKKIVDPFGAEPRREQIADLGNSLDNIRLVETLIRRTSVGPQEASFFVVAQQPDADPGGLGNFPNPHRNLVFGVDPYISVRIYGSSMTTPPRTVHQLRVVVEVDDFDEAVALYRDVLGLDELAAFEGEGDARVIILDAGRATLELANTAQVDMIDEVEVGHRVSPHIRLAFEVDDAAAATDHLVANGATLIAAPVETPWRSSNSRLGGAGGLQLTLFAELATKTER